MKTKYFQFLCEKPGAGSYMIRQHRGPGWTLWHFGGSGHLSLHRLDTAEEIDSDTPQALMDYCRTVTNEDPHWNYFHERVFRLQSEPENRMFPTGLGVRKNWVEGVGDE